MREHFNRWIDYGTLFVARQHDQIVGTLVVSECAPGYVSQQWQRFPTDACYLEAFVTARSLSGWEIGHGILQWAEHYALQAGKTSVWLACWAENQALCHYYEMAGFLPQKVFVVGEWRGQLFEKCLSAREDS